MPIMKSKMKSSSLSAKAEMPATPSLAVAYSTQRRSKKPMPAMAQGGEVESHYASIADAILAKKRMAEGGQVDLNKNSEEEPNQLIGMNEDAANEEQYDLDQLSAQPEDSNEHGDDLEDEDEHSSMIGAIRRKMKAKKGA